jgi:hypothetical protein
MAKQTTRAFFTGKEAFLVEYMLKIDMYFYSPKLAL